LDFGDLWVDGLGVPSGERSEASEVYCCLGVVGVVGSVTEVEAEGDDIVADAVDLLSSR
jgi:hypothetical protein